MALRRTGHAALGCTVVMGIYLAATMTALGQEDASQHALAIASSQISIAGTSNIHAYTASTSTVRVTRVQLAGGLAGPAFWDEVVKPGALEAFEIAIPAATLSSSKEGLDKNMHKALKVKEHEDITFRLVRLQAREGTPGALRAVGMLTVAGVEREIALDLDTERGDGTLTVRGTAPLLMTDFGIKPPKAMLGMLKTDPKVTVTFETVLTVPLT